MPHNADTISHKSSTHQQVQSETKHHILNVAAKTELASESYGASSPWFSRCCLTQSSYETYDMTCKCSDLGLPLELSIGSVHAPSKRAIFSWSRSSTLKSNIPPTNYRRQECSFLCFQICGKHWNENTIAS
eukprot:Blabericola_migrator_1__1974@NODE_1539_length_4318_cov_16_186544_g1012_i0_p1_GENE_NODE_1539_length_4318_cov_16_186544_g1012_i0NODE_1539_length_4318_cov_16_186544_g1012_i0_p1_ORF_typecomplete_len131_score10_31_NODE_1539_length_4318_cov_16_186544_g1012_i025612953